MSLSSLPIPRSSRTKAVGAGIQINISELCLIDRPSSCEVKGKLQPNTFKEDT